jgi:hypothetical protein
MRCVFSSIEAALPTVKAHGWLDAKRLRSSAPLRASPAVLDVKIPSQCLAPRFKVVFGCGRVCGDQLHIAGHAYVQCPGVFRFGAVKHGQGTGDRLPGIREAANVRIQRRERGEQVGLARGSPSAVWSNCSARSIAASAGTGSIVKVAAR